MGGSWWCVEWENISWVLQTYKERVIKRNVEGYTVKIKIKGNYNQVSQTP